VLSRNLKKGIPGGVLEALVTLFWSGGPGVDSRRHRGSPPGAPGALVTRISHGPAA
jgi:hypothetical protein